MSMFDSTWLSEQTKEAILNNKAVAAQLAGVFEGALEQIRPQIDEANRQMLKGLQGPDISWMEFPHRRK